MKSESYSKVNPVSLNPSYKHLFFREQFHPVILRSKIFRLKFGFEFVYNIVLPLYLEPREKREDYEEISGLDVGGKTKNYSRENPCSQVGNVNLIHIYSAPGGIWTRVPVVEGEARPTWPPEHVLYTDW